MSCYFQTGAKQDKLFPAHSEKASLWSQMLTEATQSRAESYGTWSHLSHCNRTAGQLRPAYHFPLSAVQCLIAPWLSVSTQWPLHLPKMMWLWLISEMKENSILPIRPLFVVSFTPGEQNLQTHLHHNVHVKQKWHLQKEQAKMLLISDSHTKWKSTAAAIMS